MSGWWRLDTSVLDSVSLCQPVINMTTSDRWQCSAGHHSHLVDTWYTLSAGTYKYSITKSELLFDQADPSQMPCVNQVSVCWAGYDAVGRRVAVAGQADTTGSQT